MMRIIFKFIGFTIIFPSGFIVFIHFLDSKSWWALPAYILWFIGSLGWVLLTESKKCPDCGKKCKMTGVSGGRYKQWYCKFCTENFWTTLFLEDYK